jgi:hypothetical protein
MRFIQTLLYNLCAGLIVVYYSESMFWSGLQRNLNPFELGFTCLIYSLVFYLIQVAATHFRVQTVAGWFVLGAIYGWLIEGVIVQTTYDSLPINISWTALAWHAPFSILLGWYAMRRWLRQGWRQTALAALGIGLLQGVWSLGWWQETLTDPTAATASSMDVLLSNLIFGISLLIGYWGVERWGAATSAPNRFGIAFAIGVLVLWFVFVTVPIVPVAALVLPLCLLLTLAVLWRGRNHPPQAVDISPVPFARYLLVLFIPLVASGVYAALNGAQFELQPLFGIVLIPLGFVALVVSLWRVWRGRRGRVMAQ